MDRLRLLAIYLLCYGLPDSDFKTVSKLVETKEERDLLKLVRQFAMAKVSDPDFKKPSRIVPQIS